MKRACSTCGRVDCASHPRWDAGSTAKWRRLRASVLRRDLYLCQIRGPGCAMVATHADHITPKVQGGRDTMENLQAACEPCNLSKGG